MNVEIGAEATQFPGKEYINGIAFAVHVKLYREKFVSTGRELGGLGHPNLAGVVGLAGRDDDEPVCLVSDYLDYGDLHQFLQNQAAAVWLPNHGQDFRSV